MSQNLLSGRGLSFERLEVLLKVHDAGSIAAAAPGSPSQQSQFSRQLRELSEFFGAEIAHRQGRLMKLTPLGLRLAELARTQVTSLADLRAECQASSVGYKIAAGESVLRWVVIPRLKPIKAGRVSVAFSTVNLSTGEVVHQVQEGRIDFGVVRSNSVPKGIKSAPLGCMTFGGIAPRAIVVGKSLSLRDFFNSVPLAILETDGQFSSGLRDVAQICGATFRPALSCQSFTQVMSGVQTGYYGGVLPTSAIAELPTSQFIKPEKPEAFKSLWRPLVLIWNPRTLNIRDGASKVLDFLQTTLCFT
jgi:DNA-binding transcriptional LysR family regulator